MTPDEVKTLLESTLPAAIEAAMKPLSDEVAALKAAATPAVVDEEAIVAKASANSAAAIKLAVDTGVKEAVKLATEQIFGSLNAQLGHRVGVTFRAASPTEGDPAATGPEAVVNAKLAALKAEGKKPSECYRLAAHAHPAEYQAALAAGTLAKL